VNVIVAAISFGLVSGAILSVSAIGFTLQFGMTNILNLAYGSVMTLGALITYLIGKMGYSQWLGAAAGTIGAGILSLALGRTLIRAFARRGSRVFEMAMVTVAASLVIDYALASITHSNILQFNFPTGREHRLLGMAFSTTELIIMGIVIVAVAALEFALHWTRMGVALRATAANPALARASGINSTQIVNITWVVSGCFAGLGGVTLALSYSSVSFTIGTSYLPYILAVVVLAGIGSIGYAVIIAIALSVVIQVAGALGAANYDVAIALCLLLVTLLIRPQGLFGQLFDKQEIVA
jgi:branched-subunit amino acid ABC-type transport system permease component